ncbi:tetratricopeptide repeat protein [Legionella drancourtii]|uniref:Tetratricopeptide repeat protein n=1 Tax=Legionella drancourtii LLAP12 TaxID=658187 RepID=G9ERC6_9GAMM|nr:hypothetical protein [Legionella drancourtii]EHL30095.1 hypothetical protein LDG_7838 [Legionella drancourtii LLAP12]
MTTNMNDSTVRIEESSFTATANPGIELVLLGRLLFMAQQYLAEGNLRQATEICWKLVSDHPGTVEADAAKGILLDLADSYERNDERHMARSIYEHLMNLDND